MIAPGLALEQAPPFSAPLRFFLTAPLFLAAAGLLAAWQPDWSADVRVPFGLALTHLLTLGFLGMVMLGALTQMLPVVAGAPVPGVRRLAALDHLALLLGTPLLACGLAGGGEIPLLAAGTMLCAGLLATWQPAEPVRLAGQLLLGLAALVFALATPRLPHLRKRKIPDVALSYWRLGMASLILAAALLPLAHSPELLGLTGLLFLPGFAVSVVNGMLCKIVPFLAWFHLQGQRGILAGGLPSMKDYLPDAACRAQFRLHLAALACLLPAPFLPLLAVPGGLLLAASALRLGWNLSRAARHFHAHGGRF